MFYLHNFHVKLFYYLVIFPKLMRVIGERMFLTDEFQFFIDILQNLVSERASSKEV